MALFRNKGKGPPDPLPMRIDQSWGDPVGRRIRLAARSSDGETVLTLLDGAADAHEREFLLQAAVHGVERTAWADKLPDLHPDRASAWLVRGAARLHQAWAARGGKHQTVVSDAASAAAHALFEQADADLVHASRLADGDPTPWSCLTATGYGLRLGFKDTCDRFDEADQQVPWLVLAHVNMLHAAFASNGGTDETMFAFARDVTERAPRGSACHAVIPLAHVEMWHREHESDRALTIGSYFERAAVSREIGQAAERSVLMSTFDDRRQGVLARNAFALALLEMGEPARAADQLIRINERAAEEPWCYLAADAGLAFARARQRVGVGVDDESRELV